METSGFFIEKHKPVCYYYYPHLEEELVQTFDGVSINRSSLDLAKLFPTYLGLLKLGEFAEITITFDEERDCFLLNAVSHKTCEEHGCIDDDCRKLVHSDRSLQFPLAQFDEILNGLFVNFFQKKSN